jgi:cell division transport system permease protein
MSARKVRRRKPSSTPVILSIGAVLYLFGLIGIFLFAADKMVDYLKEHVQLSAYLTLNSQNEQHRKIEKEITSWPEVLRVEYISAEEAAASFEEELGDNFTNIIGNNPLPASLQIFLKAEYGNEQTLKDIEERVASMSGVYEVVAQKDIVETIEKNRRLGSMLLLGLLGVFVLIAIILINNTVRLAVYSKRFIIRSMQLVGATEWFITRPFVWSAVINGLIGGLIAAVLYFSTAYFIGSWIQEFLFGNEMAFFSSEQIASDLPYYLLLLGSSLAAGTLIAGISTYISTRKYIYSSIDDLY